MGIKYSIEQKLLTKNRWGGNFATPPQNRVNECNKRSTSIKALFDSCSQQTYISDTVVKNLNLTPLRRVNMVVKTFGNKHGKDYDNVFKEQLKLGIIEEVEGAGEVGHVTYLPHREVTREDKTSTKLRVVFDASAKSRENGSLNDVLYKGPCLTPLLYDVLLRFRIHPVAFASERNIAWNFSITEAPWYGGFWERLVSIVKRCIKKTIRRTSLTFVELQTLLFEVESIINSRPLGALYDDDFEEVLTPHYLLFGRNLETSNTRDGPLNVDIPTSKRVQYI